MSTFESWKLEPDTIAAARVLCIVSANGSGSEVVSFSLNISCVSATMEPGLE